MINRLFSTKYTLVVHNFIIKGSIKLNKLISEEDDKLMYFVTICFALFANAMVRVCMQNVENKQGKK